MRVITEDSYFVTYGVQTPDPLTNRDSSPVVKAYFTELAKKAYIHRINNGKSVPMKYFPSHYAMVGHCSIC